MSHESARARLGAYSDRDLTTDAKDLEIAELRAQLEEARTALQNRPRQRARTRELSFKTASVWNDLWILVFVLVGGIIVSKGIAW